MHKLFPLLLAALPLQLLARRQDLPGLVACRDKVMGKNTKEIRHKRIVRRNGTSVKMPRLKKRPANNETGNGNPAVKASTGEGAGAVREVLSSGLSSSTSTPTGSFLALDALS